MGPLAGIGDSLVVGTVIPILLGVALGMSDGGSPLGAIFYIIVWNLFAYFGTVSYTHLFSKMTQNNYAIQVDEEAIHCLLYTPRTWMGI